MTRVTGFAYRVSKTILSVEFSKHGLTLRTRKLSALSAGELSMKATEGVSLDVVTTWENSSTWREVEIPVPGAFFSLPACPSLLTSPTLQALITLKYLLLDSCMLLFSMVNYFAGSLTFVLSFLDVFVPMGEYCYYGILTANGICCEPFGSYTSVQEFVTAIRTYEKQAEQRRELDGTRTERTERRDREELQEETAEQDDQQSDGWGVVLAECLAGQPLALGRFRCYANNGRPNGTAPLITAPLLCGRLFIVDVVVFARGRTEVASSVINITVDDFDPHSEWFYTDRMAPAYAGGVSDVNELSSDTLIDSDDSTVTTTIAAVAKPVLPAWRDCLDRFCQENSISFKPGK